MHQVESYTAGIEGFAYIAIMVVIYIVKQVMKMKKKETIKPFVPQEPVLESIPEIKQELDSYHYEEVDVDDDWSYAPDPGYDEVPSYSEEQLEKAITESNGDLYAAITKVKEEQEKSEIELKLEEVERFDQFKIKDKSQNTFADLLDDPENFKNAFVLSEILNRKY